MSKSDDQEEPETKDEPEEQEESETMDEPEEQEKPKTMSKPVLQGADMKELVEYIAKSIVDAPDDVKVDEETDEEGLTTLKLQVADEDKGRVIGKQGRIAEAMRALLRVKAAKASTRVRLEIV
ncbi:MAG TPA: KH domain-containing protein [Dehalococcoidales bacterium]|nr:KH domain-containing protein [Dehalococcoidales bacterium]